VLADAPGIRGEVAAGIDQPQHARDEEQQIQREVERGLPARLHVDVDEIRAHVARLGQGVGPAHHEQRAVQHVVEVEDPGGGSIEDVALEDLDGDDEGERHDQPREGLARPVADLIDGVDEALRVHRDRPPASHPGSPGWLACARSVTE
jgi:hypothetical protein